MRWLLLLLFLPINAGAMTSLFESGSVVNRGEYKTTLSTQFLNGNDTSSIQLVGQVETGVSESESFKLSLGAGGSSYAQFGGSYKWIPYPDIAGQPALGGVTAVRYSANRSTDNDFVIQVGPIVSKYIQFATGAFDVYSSMLFGTKVSSEWELPINFNLGAEIETIRIPDLKLYAELAIALNSASSHIFGVGISRLF